MENVLDIVTLSNDDEVDNFNEEVQVQRGRALPGRQRNNRTLNTSISFPF